MFDSDSDDANVNYEQLRRELFPLDLSPRGPYREVFDIWQGKIRAAKPRLLAENPRPTFWDLTFAMGAQRLFLSEIEKEAWVTIMNRLCAFFGVSNTDLIPITFG